MTPTARGLETPGYARGPFAKGKLLRRPPNTTTLRDHTWRDGTTNVSQIDSLIASHCPNGVDSRELGEIAELVRGSGMPKSDFVAQGVGCIHYGQIYTHYGTWATEVISHVPEDKAARLAKVEPGDLIVTNTSENLDDVGKAVAWLGNETIVTGGHATVVKPTVDPKYLAYWFQSPAFYQQKKRRATGTKVIDVSAKHLAQMRVPIPPIEVQRQIVRILDQFSLLEAELEAELEKRRRQYAHYRQRLIDHVEAEPVALGELGAWRGGMTPAKSNPAFWESGTIPWLASMDVSDEEADGIRGRITEQALEQTSLRMVPAPSVAVVMRSNILRRRLPVGLVEVDTTVNQDIRALVPHSHVDAGYVDQVLRADSERIRGRWVRTDGSMAAVDSKGFFGWTIPLPPLSEQREIAERLRNFDALVNDLSVGLPAELSARRKQYEYYRDRLLTFEETTP